MLSPDKKTHPHRRSWLVIRHVEHEHIGTLAPVLAEAGISYRYADVFRGDPVPEDPGEIGGLIIMGGPMGVYEGERYPFLLAEQVLIRRSAQAGLPVLGICLGAQLIAGALGARVYAGPHKEIGWDPVEVTDPEDDWTSSLPPRFMGFHWHGDTFDLPSGATRLFRSRLYDNQGFRYGASVLAIQFHFEITAGMIDDWLNDPGCRRELDALGVSPAAIRSETARWIRDLEQLSAKLFSRYFGRYATAALDGSVPPGRARV
jgi:GMP synthase (glutamine-hydrolysing)